MRPCWVEISTHAFENNFRFLRSRISAAAELMAVVKADAYGHSLVICAPAAVRAGARWLGVTSVEEGIAARTVCPDAQIVVMGAVFPGQGHKVWQNRLTPVVWTLNQLEELGAAPEASGAARGSLSIHLEIDSGMSRQGVAVEAVPEILSGIAANPVFWLEAVTTHLYASDESDRRTSEAQLERLRQALECIQGYPAESASRPTWVSVGASASILGTEWQMILRVTDSFPWWPIPIIRPGLALYGVVPRFDPPFEDEPENLSEGRKQLQPVLTWKTRVVSVREIPAGSEIGYNGTFVATEPMRLALIAAGYADGLDRRLGNRFSLLVGGRRAPLVGRISMDQAVLDITDIPGVQAGDEVVILGTQGEETITAYDHADAAETIPWEMFTRIGARVRRIEL